MAHFLGSVRGTRGEVSRLGGKDSGVSVTAASWQGAVVTRLYVDATTGKDFAVIELTPWHGRGASLEIYRGPVDGKKGK